MSRSLTFLAALVGASLFWCALITEITLRFLPANFIALAFLVFIACLSTGLLAYTFARRVPKSANAGRSATTDSQSPNRRSAREKRGKPDANQQGSGRERNTNQRAQPRGQSSDRTASRSSQRQSKPNKSASRNSQRSQSRSANRTSGRIKSYSSRQSYGFVVSDKGEQAFFHKTNLDPGVDDKELEKERPVSFEIQSGDRGPVATKIRLVSQEA